MRTSLNNIKAIEDYLLGSMSPGDALLFEANMLLNSSLMEDTRKQQSTYTIIQRYSRRKIKAEIMAVQTTLTTASQHRSFVHRIANLFKKD